MAFASSLGILLYMYTVVADGRAAAKGPGESARSTPYLVHRAVVR